MKKTLLIGTTLVAVTLAGFSFAITKERGEHDYMDKKMHHLSKKLDLTEQQQAQLKESMSANKQAMKAARSARHDIQQQLMQLDPKAENYQSQLEGIVLKAQEQAKNRVLLKAKQKQTLFAVLNEEQKQEFSELQKKRQSKMAERFAEGEGYKRDRNCH